MVAYKLKMGIENSSVFLDWWPLIITIAGVIIYTIRNEQKIKYLMMKIVEIEEELKEKQDKLENQFTNFVTGIDTKLQSVIVSIEILMDRDRRSRKEDWDNGGK